MAYETEDAEVQSVAKVEKAEAQLVKVEKKKPGAGDVKRTDELPIGEAAKILYAAGMARSGEDVGKILVKLNFGRSIGLSDVAAVNGLSIGPNGSLVLSAANMLALIQRSGRYKFRYNKRDDKGCEMEWWQKVDGEWWSLGVPITYTWEDSVRAGLSTKDTYRKFPRQLLNARCISDSFKAVAPDVAGVACYSPEEIDGSGYQTDPDTLEMVPIAEATTRSRAPAPVKTKLDKKTQDEIAKLFKDTKAVQADLLMDYGGKDVADLNAEEADHLKRTLLARLKASK